MLEQNRCRTGTTYPSLRSDTSIRDPTTGKFTLLVRGRLNAIFSSFFPSSFIWIREFLVQIWIRFGESRTRAEKGSMVSRQKHSSTQRTCRLFRGANLSLFWWCEVEEGKKCRDMDNYCRQPDSAETPPCNFLC